MSMDTEIFGFLFLAAAVYVIYGGIKEIALHQLALRKPEEYTPESIAKLVTIEGPILIGFGISIIVMTLAIDFNILPMFFYFAGLVVMIITLILDIVLTGKILKRKK